MKDITTIKRYAYMKILGLIVPLDENHHFFDDGYVEDIYTHLERLDRIYQCHIMVDSLLKKSDMNKVSGITVSYCLKRDNCDEKVVHIFYKKPAIKVTVNGDSVPEEVFEIMTRAHEETHALEYLGKINYLKKEIFKLFLSMSHPNKLELLDWFNPSLLLSKNTGKLAKLGVSYALFKRCYPLDYFRIYDFIFLHL